MIIQHRTVSLAYVTEKYNPTKKEFDGTDARDVVSKILQEMADPEVGLLTRIKNSKGKERQGQVSVSRKRPRRYVILRSKRDRDVA